MPLFEDEDKIDELEKFNRKRSLENILAAEEHLSLEDIRDDLPCSHIWCARKHMMMVEDHMREAIEHADEDRAEVYREARKKVSDWVEDGKDVRELRKLRNWLRGKFRDTSLKVDCKDGVCKYDVEGLAKSDKDEIDQSRKDNGKEIQYKDLNISEDEETMSRNNLSELVKRLGSGSDTYKVKKKDNRCIEVCRA